MTAKFYPRWLDSDVWFHFFMHLVQDEQRAFELSERHAIRVADGELAADVAKEMAEALMREGCRA